LAKYNLPTPTSIFTLDYFKKSPEPFFDLAKELYPGKWRPTTAHYLVSMLSAKGMLLRNYTQNIDGLELLAGVEERDLIAAHGTFGSATCMGAQCKKAFPSKIVRGSALHCISSRQYYAEIPRYTDSVFAGTIPRCDSCNSVIKPDVVMFGEDLPQKFFQSTKHDFPSADLLIVMGTSLAVTPFNTLIDKVPESTPRLLINRDKVGMQEEERKKAAIRGFETTGFSFDDPSNIRDVFAQGNCDDVVLKLVHLMGWSTEFTNYKTEMTEKAQEIALKHGFCTQ
jgi:NAD-dependent deacetylase sirtuin 2